MKALIYDGPETLGFRDAAAPTPAAGEVLIRIDAVGICGSDMHAYLGHDDRRPAPLILGHEGAGVIIGGPRDGERVTINPLVNCGTCPACLSGRENLCPERLIISMPPREGAFAQYVAMRPENLVTVPEGVSLDKAALAEPLAVSWHAARLGLEALHPGASRTALVLGGGAIGLAAALAFKALGLDDVTIADPNDNPADIRTLDAGKLYRSAPPRRVICCGRFIRRAGRGPFDGFGIPPDPCVHIGVVQSAGADLNQDFTRSRLRSWPIRLPL